MRQRGEPDLVVDHDVHRATGLVAVELRHVERLRHNALPDESAVAVDYHRQYLFPLLRVIDQALKGTRFALHHRRHRFEVAGVRGEVDAHLAAVDRGAGVVKTEVILHVTVTVGDLLHVVVAEFVEQELVVLADDVGQHVEPAAVSHAHRDLKNPSARRCLNDGVEHRDQRLAALERKPFLADVTGVQEFLELLGIHQALEDAPFFFA